MMVSNSETTISTQRTTGSSNFAICICTMYSNASSGVNRPELEDGKKRGSNSVTLKETYRKPRMFLMATMVWLRISLSCNSVYEGENAMEGYSIVHCLL